MKIFKKKYLHFWFLGLFVTLFSGCQVPEQTISPNTQQPTFSGGAKVETDLPTVTATPSLPGELTSTLNTYRLYVTFSEDMDSNTISPTTVYIRDLTSGAPVDISGLTVEYDTQNRTLQRAYIEYLNPSTITAIELIVTSGVKDLAGNGVAGLVGLLGGSLITPPSGNTIDRTIEHDYRTTIGAAATYDPARVTSIFWSTADSTTADFTVEFSTANIDATTIAATDFTIAAADGTDIKSSCTFTNLTGTDVTFTNCVTVANTEYTLTFTPGASFATTSQYPDAATAVVKTHIFDTKNNVAGQSDFVQSFITLFNDDTTPDGTLPNVTSFNNLSSPTVTINFSKAMDKTGVIDTGNYTVLSTGSPVKNLEFEIVPVYTPNGGDTDTEIRSVRITTVNKSNYSIGEIRINTNLTSDASVALTNEVFDQDGDNRAEMLNDYDKDGQPDEWP